MRKRIAVLPRCVVLVIAVLFLSCSGPAFAQEGLCPDGKRAYFGVCPGDKPGEQSRPPPSQLPQTLRNSINMDLVLLQAGTFQMGSNDDNDNAKSVHTVRISRPFYLGKYEVTQAQWEAVMGNNPSKFKGDPNRPVEQVYWGHVQEFILRLQAKEGGARYRLPTEAEWEYAARAGSTTAYSFGDAVNQLGQYAWCDGNAGNTTRPVGRLQPNIWGLYDMHGLVPRSSILVTLQVFPRDTLSLTSQRKPSAAVHSIWEISLSTTPGNDGLRRNAIPCHT